MAYYVATDLTRHTLARAEELNAQLAAIEVSFALLPTEDELKEHRANYNLTTGAANAYVVTSTYPRGAYTDGMEIALKIHAANTGASTVNVDGLGAIPIRRVNNTDVELGDLPLNGSADMRYNSTHNAFLVTTGLADAAAAASSASAAAVSASAASSSASAAAASAAAAAATVSDTVLLDGSRTMTGALQVEKATTGNVFTGISTAAGASSAPSSELYREIVGANNNLLGSRQWTGQNDAGTKIRYAEMKPKIIDAAAGAESGELLFLAPVAGVLDQTVGKVGYQGFKDQNDHRFHSVKTGQVAAVDLSSGSPTEGEFTSIRPDATRITMTIDAVSHDGAGTPNLIVQLGKSAGYVAGGYAFVQSEDGTTIGATSTAFALASAIAGSAVVSGVVVFTRHQGGDVWMMAGHLARVAATAYYGVMGSVDVGGELDRIKLAISSDVFDAGEVSIIVE